MCLVEEKLILDKCVLVLIDREMCTDVNEKCLLVLIVGEMYIEVDGLTNLYW